MRSSSGWPPRVWPGSKCGIPIMIIPNVPGLLPWPAVSAWWRPAAATTTAPSTPAVSAARRHPRRSTSGCSARPPALVPRRVSQRPESRGEVLLGGVRHPLRDHRPAGDSAGVPRAEQASVVAFAVIVAFALFGRSILTYTGVGLPALEGAGGLLLLLVSLQLLTGQAEEPTSTQRAKANVAFVPLGTPLLAGPGAIVATMLFVQRVHNPLNALALALAIVAVAAAAWLSMRFAPVIHRVLTDNGVELLTRIAGLLLS